MTFLDIQNSVAYYLDDLNFGYFTPTQVKLWINNAQKEVQKRLLIAANSRYNKCVQTTLIVKQSDYVLPSDFKKLMSLAAIISGTPPNETISPVVPITTNQQFIAGTGIGTPTYYHFKRDRIVISPAPSSALTMRMEYAYMVTDMVLDTDIPDAPGDYHELIALLAAEDGFIKDGRVSALLEKKIKEYQDHLDADAQERNQDVPRGIVDIGTEYGGYIY